MNPELIGAAGFFLMGAAAGIAVTVFVLWSILR
jgi:hypothetical protein